MAWFASRTHKQARTHNRKGQRLFVEQLELRTLLSGNPPLASGLGVKGPISNALLNLYDAANDLPATSLVESVPKNLLSFDSAGRVGVTVTAVDTTAVATELARMGFRLAAADANLHTLQGYLPINAVAQIQNLNDANLLGVQPMFRAQTSVGKVTSQGDFVLEADRVRATTPGGVDGTGVTVGVLSDSYNSLGGAAADVASGDLPAAGVKVLQEDPNSGTDEGRAMLQIVHDIAPGAALDFATADDSELGFAQNIKNLADPAQGNAQVITDDVFYFDEPYYQEGPVAQAVDSVVTNNHVSYFSSAGNLQDQAYEATNVGFISDSVIGLGLGKFLDFSQGTVTGGVDRQSLTLTAGQEIILGLQWAQPFFTTHSVTTDLDIYLLDHSTGQIVAGSADDNIANQTPLELFSFQNPTGASHQYDLVIQDFGGPAPARLKWVNFGSNDFGPVQINNFNTHSPTITPHSGTPNAMSVGAAPFFDQRNPESFTSEGPYTILFKPDGTAQTAQVVAKPDIAAVDGVDTTFFGQDIDGNGFPNFFGTSAAAPHAAGVAALLKAKNPAFTPTQIYTALQQSADPNIGGTPGNVNLVGAGLIDAYRAIIASQAAPALPNVTDGFETGFLGTDWTTYTSGAGRTLVSKTNSPASGTYHLTMDGSLAGFAFPLLNEATLHINPTGDNKVMLSFKEKEFNDPDDPMPATFSGHGNFDGVALSVDGVHWFKLVSLTGATSTNSYQTFSVDVSQFAAANSLTLSADTQIKFQHYDVNSFMIPNQGFAFDDVRVTANHPPVAHDDTASTGDLSPVTVNVLANDTDPDLPNDTLTVISVGTPSPNKGTVTFTSSNVTYTPLAGFHGTVTFSYTISDSGGLTSSANVTITVIAEPTANAQSVTTNANSAANITLTGTDPQGEALTFAIAANPANGTLSGLNAASGAVTYTPKNNFVGADSFTFTVTNTFGLSSTAATVSITVNGAPTANPQTVLVPQDTATAITLTGTDPNSLPLTFTVTANPSHGTLSGTAPSLTYTPAAGYIGPDSFQFTVNNGLATSAAATVSITDVGTPTANAQAVTVAQDTAQGITLTGADPNTPPLSLRFTVTGNPAHGTLSGTAPSLTYTPAAGYFGTDSFQFTDSNGTATSAAASVSITVVGQPTANAQSVSALQDTPANVTLTASDPNSPPKALSFTVTVNPAHGTLSGTAPNLTFTPAAGYFGADSFKFTATNGVATSVAATISITVVGKPTADAQTVTVPQDTATAVTLTGSDPNTPALPLTFAVTVNPSHGTLSGTAPNLTYTPAAGYFGPDSFQFTDNNGQLTSAAATVSITDVGKPTANVQAVTVPQDTATGVTLTGSDPNSPPRSLTFTVTVNPSHGTLSGTAPSLTYTPAAGYFGPDSFQFTVNNGVLTSAAATVSITDVGKPTANAQAVTVPQDTATAVTLTGSDPNTPPLKLTFTVSANPSHGTVSGTAPNLTYTPAAGYFGPDSFQFTVSNGVVTSAAATVTITDVGKPTANAQTVTVPQDTATAVTLTGSDPNTPPLGLTFTVSANPSHGTLSGTAPNLTYTPAAGYFGADSFQFTVNNGVVTSVAAVVSINDVGQPTANAQAVTVAQDTASAITLTGSDPNTPPRSLTFSVTVNPTNGTLSGTAPNLTYTPNAGYFGADSFQFTVNNGVLTSAAATVSITDVGKPTANAQAVTVPQDTATAVTLTGSDPNTPPRTLTFTVTANPSHGTLSGTAPNLTYTPAAGYFGADSFQFTVSNGVVTSAAATVTITDVGQPTANAQTVTVPQDTATAITLTGSDPNTPPRTLTFTVSANPSHGTLSGTAPNLTYTPGVGYSGADSFQFTVSNGVVTSTAATVTITDVGQPTANAQTVTVAQDTATAITLTGSDPNTPPRTLTFTVTANPSHGTLSGTAPNLTYTPAAGYFGADSFQFTVNNGVLTSAAATVSITDVGQPTANAQAVTVPQDTATAVTLTGSDPNTPPRTLTFTVTANPGHGTLSGTAPNLTYTPAAGYFGADSFQFTVSNGVVTSAAATVAITDVGKPTANAQSVNVPQDTATGVTLTGSDPNTPPLALTFTVTANPSHGTLSGTAPNLTYTPAAGYFGPDSFQFTVNNGVLTSAAATISITDIGKPSANSQSQSTGLNTAANITLTGSDPQGQTLSFTISANPGHGTLSGFNASTGAVTYTPDTGFVGTDTFQFTVTNTSNLTSSAATVSVAVKQATISGDVAVAWGSQTASLATATDGLRLLPAGRKTDIPWMNVKSIQVTLSQATTLTAADVTVSGVNVANYGPVTVSGSGTSFTITFAAPIAKADRVTVTISNATIATFTRRLDILPGDFKDQGYVDIADVVAILIASRRAYDPFADINGDGKVDSSGPNSDVALARLLIGTKLP